MLISLALIFLLGLMLGKIFNQLKLPSLLGMIIDRLYTKLLKHEYYADFLDLNM
ncbi:hypothetical protein CPAL_17320 [Clostridium thermopalmarium DSM 5974]|jgi:hypothetical protein|uniref:Uncharacterized protein n=2 Tax=Clostridium TaxID=1485 RepID=A0A151AQY1_9CLOT|nr:hypothetical protein CLCOL_06740 [Clostridium colicanis DSM 13634]PRR71525.1 hypothetical protein CPAL_17320 [Clostridium thermopalmarium DSM 5974]PVZ20813.1 hypothetical protein LX19_02627 [Clostridium thermopalmarium DSM 5974]